MARSLEMATRGKQGYTVNELHYLAGVIDSDGCISIGKMKAGKQRTANPRYVLMITVVNTSETLMKWIQERFGGSFKARPRISERHKVTYSWYYNNGKALWLLHELAPLLVVKREQAMVGISLIEGWKTPGGGMGMLTDSTEVARREAHYWQMRNLNQTGPVQPQRLSPLAPA